MYISIYTHICIYIYTYRVNLVFPLYLRCSDGRPRLRLWKYFTSRTPTSNAPFCGFLPRRREHLHARALQIRAELSTHIECVCEAESELEPVSV